VDASGLAGHKFYLLRVDLVVDDLEPFHHASQGYFENKDNFDQFGEYQNQTISTNVGNVFSIHASFSTWRGDSIQLSW
jgi:hypothetical protein